MTGLRSRVDAVVIGASAGGVEALRVVLTALPSNWRLPVFCVVHLPKDRHQAAGEDKAAVEPGTLYFAPPDYHLLIDRGPSLALSADPPLFYSRPSIDVLFESAADVFGPRLLGIILTGANEDGARGLAAVRAAGGTAIVQDPTTAVAKAMPTAALCACPGASVLALEQISLLLRSLQ